MPKSSAAQEVAMTTLTTAHFEHLMEAVTSCNVKTGSFTSCTARYNGERNSSRVEEFIASISTFKTVEKISDVDAVNSMPTSILNVMLRSGGRELKLRRKRSTMWFECYAKHLVLRNQTGAFMQRFSSSICRKMNQRTVLFVKSVRYSLSWRLR